MNITLADVPRRIIVKPFKTEGILGYDIDNAYPQRIMRMVGASGTARNCVRIYSKFIDGMGFKDEVTGDTIVNRDGDTANIMLSEETAPDFAHFGGFACHVNYNLAFQKTSITAIPFETARLVLPDLKKGYGKHTHIALYDDWGKEFHRRINPKKIDFINVFNDDPAVVSKQIEAAGGIQNYKGQVFWYSNMKKGYPIPVFDPVLEDIDTDAGLKVYRNSNVRTGFSAGYVYVYMGKFESDDARQEYIQAIQDFQGPEVAGSIMLVEAETPEQIPKLLEVKSQINDKVIKITNDSTKDCIIESFGMPSVLVNADSNSGITFSNDQLKLAYDYYNTITASERQILARQMTKLFDKFHQPIGPFEIAPLEWTIATSTPTE